ncbi:MAG: flavodoxin-dependent (E)-4-hydroxy-3-methylbut-2-enyl-diphosphate synthase [Clostridia bacterium]|nr:flavodoxin-dependent (E)-4-hydroxy-3-methylbut-2-enyl-diphosphate synthase [Clostridia bacterium]
MRRRAKEVQIGNIKIGGDNRIAVQSMLSIPSYDVKNSVKQAKELKSAGCDILRIAIPDIDAVKLIDAIKSEVDIPLVADIHFNYKLALESVAAGIDKIRINPGNIGDEEKIKAVAKACRNGGIPIRIGVNSGSVEKHLLEKHGGATPDAMTESALYNAKLLEKFDFNNIVISIKSSSVQDTVKAYKLIAEKCNYPLHLGVTEAGTETLGTLKSAIGIGSLLLGGIGDTIRVSLTDSPLKEVETGINILKSLDMYGSGIKFVSCPTCGRTRINLIKIAKEAEKALANCKKNLKIAIMGCVVNGPGEAKDADIGITGANGIGIIFKKGEVIRKVPEEQLISELIKEVESMPI